MWRVLGSDSTSLPAGPPLLLRNHSHIVWQCCFNADGSKLATVSEDGTALVFALPDSSDTASVPVEVACFAPSCGMRAVSFLDADTLMCGAGDGTLFTVNLMQSHNQTR